MLDDASLIKHFPALLKNLKARIKALPVSLPVAVADPDGHFARHLHFEIDAEGAKFTANRQWERAFYVPEAEKKALIARGKYGMDLICPFLEFWAEHEEMKGTDGVGMLARRIHQLNALMDSIPELALVAPKAGATSGSVPPSQFFTPRPRATPAVIPAKRPQAHESEDDINDKNYNPPRDPPDVSEQEESDTDTLNVPTSGKGKLKATGPKPKQQGSKKPPAKRQKVVPVKDSDDESESPNDDEAPAVRRGRSDKQAKWVITNYLPPTIAKSKTGDAVWRWECKWCSASRSSPRTAGCTLYENETIIMKVASNFHSHIKACKRIPSHVTYEAYEAAVVAQAAGGGTQPVPTAGASSTAAQRATMAAFIQEGIAHPAVVLTQRGFRERLVKGIAFDDLPFSFPEKRGMNALLKYLLPRGWKIPGRKTVKADIVLLSKLLKERVDMLIRTNSSKLAIAQDLWTSKNSVYAFCGGVGWLIDDEWNLREFVLDLITLDGDHSGAATGRLLFHNMKKRGLVEFLLAAAGDNASSNGSLCAKICELMWRMQLHLSAENMQIGCAGHVLNIVAQSIYHALGIADNPDVCDYYEETRKFPLAYRPADDPEVVAAATLMSSENVDAESKVAGRAGAVSDSESEVESDAASDDEASGGETLPTSVKSSSKTKPKRKMTIVDKLHETVVDINRSEVRRKRMCQLTRETCDPKDRHLVLIRGMKIRWNTTNAEIERGVTLQPALTRWNAELSRGLTGKKKTAAIKKAKRQYLSPDDFDNLRKIVNVMTILQEATLDLSKKKVPTICKVLPLYKIVQTHLEGQLKTIPPAGDTCNLRAAIQAGLAKLKIHTEKALISDYPLIGAVLHPAIRLVYFESGQWDSGLASRARIILEHLYDVYKEEWEESNPPASTSKHKSSTTTSPSKGIFRRALASGVASGSTLRKLQNELEVFFSGIYPMADDDDDVLAWWKLHALEFPILSRIARDVLAIPGVSIAVERLFSSSKHTMSDARSSMAAETAASTVLVKELLNAGFGDGLDYLEGISIH